MAYEYGTPSRLLSQVDRVVRDTGYTFRAPDGLIRALMDRSTGRLFAGVLAGFPEEALPVPASDFALLGRCSDDARVLALIGEVTLQVKALPGGADLTPLCDRWGLHESRIDLSCRHRPVDPREKETLARAVFGLIYVEGGADALRGVVPLLT